MKIYNKKALAFTISLFSEIFTYMYYESRN